jgi:CheY-like chemotaxis protein
MLDALRLRQVLFNLVGNALKFTAEGRVSLGAGTRRLADGSVLLHLSVTDTGPGVGPEHLDSLFDRFSQADASESRQFGGTGLGLAIVKQLVELMGGRVWVESELGRGSAFHVELPTELAAAPASTAAAAPVAAPLADPDSLRILIVDDNEVNLLVLDQLLGSLGHAVVKAASASEGLEQLGRAAFDLVLTDIHMPGMTGVEMLHALRERPGRNQDVPVIALTADVTSGGRQRYLDLGFADHAAKPIQLENLLGAIAGAAPPRLPSETEVA